jgi:hypothetical protein
MLQKKAGSLLLVRQLRLGAPFKPGFGLSRIPQHSTRLFLRGD